MGRSAEGVAALLRELPAPEQECVTDAALPALDGGCNPAGCIAGCAWGSAGGLARCCGRLHH